MNKTRRYLIIISLLILLAIVLWQAPRSPLHDLVTDTPAPLKQYPTAYLNNIKTTQYNPQGQIAHILTASKVSHFEQTNQGKTSSYAILDNPVIIIFNHDKPNALPWHASSTHGRSINNGEELILEGNVILTQQPNKEADQTNSNSDTATITTEQLTIKPDQQYAETNKPVMIKNDTSTTTSTGFNISLDSQQTNLLSRVRGRYDIR